jgi:hypothetical protein
VITTSHERESRPPLIRLYADEAIADLFAGGGGASEGIEMGNRDGARMLA